MKDELWMRTWNDGHPQFSDDLHRGLLWVLASFRRLADKIKRRARAAGTNPLPVPQRDVV